MKNNQPAWQWYTMNDEVNWVATKCGCAGKCNKTSLFIFVCQSDFVGLLKMPDWTQGSHGSWNCSAKSWKMKKEKSGPEKSWNWALVLKKSGKVLIFDHSGAEKSIRPARQLGCCN